MSILNIKEKMMSKHKIGNYKKLQSTNDDYMQLTRVKKSAIEKAAYEKWKIESQKENAPKYNPKLRPIDYYNK